MERRGSPVWRGLSSCFVQFGKKPEKICWIETVTVVAFDLHQSCSQEPPHESEEQLGGHRVQGGDAGA